MGKKRGGNPGLHGSHREGEGTSGSKRKGRKRKEAGKESGANQGSWKLRGALEGRMVWGLMGGNEES